MTNGAGSLPGSIINDGTLVLNRPDDASIANTLSGSGTLQKDQASTATFTASTTLFTPVVLNAGTLKFSAGGTLGGTLSGAGNLDPGGGTLLINGAANTNTGTTTVSAGLLQLNNGAGGNAVGGNVTITGTGQLALLAGEQIPDTATLTFTGSSTDSIPAPVGTETVLNVIANSSVGDAVGGQVIMRNNFAVLGTATLTSGVLGVASGSTATLNAVVINAAPGANALLRIAGNGGPSTLNVGPGGITARGGEIQVKFNVNNQDAVLNLGGDFTATGNVAITNAGYAGPNLNVINLVNADRTFDIAGGTTTTVAPAVAGIYNLIKTGAGTLTLNGDQNYPVLATVSGTTNLNKTLGTGSSSIFSTGTTHIAMSQTLDSLDIGNGGAVVVGGPFAAPAPDFVGNDAGGFSEGAVQAVPEPESMSLLALGALGFLWRRKRG